MSSPGEILERLQWKSVSVPRFGVEILCGEVLCVKMDLLCGWPRLASGRLESSLNPYTVWGPSVDAEGTGLRWLLTATAYCDSLTAVRGNLLLRALWHLRDVLTVQWNLKLRTVWLFLFPSRFHLFGVRLHYQFDSHMPRRSGGGSLIEITDSLFWDPGMESSSLWEKERRNWLFPLEPSQKLLVFFS